MTRKTCLLPATGILLAALVAVAPGPVVAADRPSADYSADIHPLLIQRCGRCHGAVRHEGGLRLDAASLIRKGGEDGPVIVPGKSALSKLIERVSAPSDTRMPPEGEPLSAHEIGLLKMWIDRGALAPSDERIPADPAKHWAFLRPQRPAVPVAAHSANPIDAFIETRLAREKIEPIAAAPPNIWLRRVTLDLTGLPPSVAELREFLADQSPDARARTVDRLLASPAYGERWGRHWMDVWRYSDWYGWANELRFSARHIWRWRDWIVESLNDDQPYNEMLVEIVGGRRARSGQSRSNPSDRLFGPQLFALQPRGLAERSGRAYLEGLFGHHAELRTVPRSPLRSDPTG